MKKIKLHDKTFRHAISYEEIEYSVKELAKKLNQEYAKSAEVPLFIGVLNGAFMFTAELMKQIEFTCELSFIKLASYDGMRSNGEVTRLIGLDRPVEGREVIIVEDIVETGNTIEAIARLLEDQKPKNIRVVTLFFKPEAYTRSMKVDHYAMELPNDFIVGFGLDYDQLGRNLKDIYTLVVEA